MIEESEIEILITFFKLLLNFIILKLLNYHLRIQNRNSNYFFKISLKKILNICFLIFLKFYNFKTFQLS